MGVRDNVNDVHVVSSHIVSSAMSRGCSPLGAAGDGGALDETLTDDSVGLTPSPGKAIPMRGRARSVLRGQTGGRPPLTKRPLSLTHRSRVTTRVASPAVLERLRNVSVPVKAAADAAVEDRLAALEQQAILEHAYKIELVQAVQNL